jgi:hypothetical protein
VKHEPTDAQVQRDTAQTWVKRAIRYRKRAERDGAQCEWWRRFDDARHEALEHAALVGDRGKTVARVQAMVDRETRRR